MRIPDKLRDIDFLVERLGFPIIICGFFAYLLFVRFEQVDKKFTKIIRNQSLIMKKLHIEQSALMDEKK
jgi:hypothetical protein